MAHTLYYDPTNDSLVVGFGSHTNKDLVPLFHSYEEKGYNHNKPTVEVGDSKFAFTIETNFGHGDRSYLKFRVVYRGNPLYSFPSISEPEGKNGPSRYFCVEPDASNWYELFNLLCYVYKNRENWNINECLDWLKERLQYDNLEDPIRVALSLRGLFQTLDATGLGTCNPVRELTEQVCTKELPILTKYLLENNCAPNNIVYNAIELLFGYLTSVGRMDIFLKSIYEDNLIARP